MNPETVALIQNSWEKVRPISEVAAKLFYDRLFELDPSVRTLFKTPMGEQGRNLMNMIDVAVSRLSRLDTLVPAIRDLGARHAGYGVEDHHYETVGAALLWTLKRGLGEDFTPEVENAWTETYYILVDTMKGAAARAA